MNVSPRQIASYQRMVARSFPHLALGTAEWCASHEDLKQRVAEQKARAAAAGERIDRFLQAEWNEA